MAGAPYMPSVQVVPGFQADDAGATWAPGARMNAEILGNRAYTFHLSLALLVHAPLQLIFARVPVQTLTEHWSNRECRRVTPVKTKRLRSFRPVVAIRSGFPLTISV
jgi:hypothetical protein